MGLGCTNREAIHLGTDIDLTGSTDSRNPEGSMGVTGGYSARSGSKEDPGSWQWLPRLGDH